MTSSSPQGSRKVVFWLILLILPVAFFALLEIGARLAGLGVQYPLFIPVENEPNYLQPNPDVIKRFFSRPELAPNVSPDTVYFLAKKPADSLRIVIMGGSTAAGFPYGRFGSPAGMLEQRLKPLYPEKHIEIINVAMAAVNSYTLRDFTPEVLAIKPDLVLIYAGHNEYLGVMGVGSSLAARDSRWKTLTYIALRHSALFQGFDSLIAGIRQGASVKKEVNEHTLMATVAENKNIPMDSAVYEQGLRQFEENMTDIITAFEQAKIPVVIGTLASNERDQAPFSSQGSDDPALVSALASANDLMQKNDFIGAKVALVATVKSYPLSADAHYALAKVFEALKNNKTAREHYLKAKDLDLLRFRAPEAINEKIRNLSAKKDVYLADVQELVRSKSSNNIIGSDMMLEHLHPTSTGYFWLAEAYFQAIEDNKLLPEHEFKLLPEQVVRLKPITEVDEQYAAWTIQKLTSDYPFAKEPKKIELGLLDTPIKKMAAERYLEKANWIDNTQSLFKYYQEQKNARAALLTAGQLSDALPMNADVALIAGRFAMELQLTQLVLFYSERGLRIEPNNEALLMLKAHTLFLMNRHLDSKKILETVLKINPQHPIAKKLLDEPWVHEIDSAQK